MVFSPSIHIKGAMYGGGGGLFGAGFGAIGSDAFSNANGLSMPSLLSGNAAVQQPQQQPGGLQNLGGLHMGGGAGGMMQANAMVTSPSGNQGLSNSDANPGLSQMAAAAGMTPEAMQALYQVRDLWLDVHVVWPIAPIPAASRMHARFLAAICNALVNAATGVADSHGEQRCEHLVPVAAATAAAAAAATAATGHSTA